MPTLEQVRADNQRITAGIPSLTSKRRQSITHRHLLAIYQKECQQQYADNEAKAKASDGAIRDVTDWDQIAGIVLPAERIIGRLRKLNHNLYFERSHADPSKTGIYLLKNDFRGGQEKEFLCGMEAGLNPEYSLRVTDDEGNAKGIVSGWRRVLMRLIRAGVISEYRAHAIFGPPSRDSENWMRFAQ